MEWENMSLSVLIVDDCEVNRTVASLMLKKLGHHVDFAANGIEAIEALEHQPYDAILMDIQMPVMDGIEATKIIRQRWRNGPRIIAATAQAISFYACLGAGVDDFLVKPLKIEKLRAAIEYNMPIPSFVSGGMEEFSAACSLCASQVGSDCVV
ncbi:MAG: response regulator [Methanothrix sp.]|nr:response regulator [Methanothrix sp.]